MRARSATCQNSSLEELVSTDLCVHLGKTVFSAEVTYNPFCGKIFSRTAA